MRTDRLVGVGHRVGHRTVLEVEFGHHRIEAAFNGHEPRPGMMRDERGQPVVPSLAPQVQPAVERVETGLLQARCVPMSCSQAAAINTGRSAAGTVTASSAARPATPWVCSHRSGDPLRSSFLASPRALAINAGSDSITVIIWRFPQPVTNLRRADTAVGDVDEGTDVSQIIRVKSPGVLARTRHVLRFGTFGRFHSSDRRQC